MDGENRENHLNSIGSVEEMTEEDQDQFIGEDAEEIILDDDAQGEIMEEEYDVEDGPQFVVEKAPEQEEELDKRVRLVIHDSDGMNRYLILRTSFISCSAWKQNIFRKHG